MKQIQADDAVYADVSVVRGHDVATFYDPLGKRLVDVFFAVLLAPFVLAAVAVLSTFLRLFDGGSPFFVQTRVGKGGVPFRCFKLRTMVPDAEARLAEHLAENPDAAAEWEILHKLTRDPRVTPLGAILRRTGLDELPQLWNVLRGEMSLVGPRPVLPDELERYGASRAAYCAMRPGITGLWQVSGRNGLTYDERVALDERYLRRMSPKLDLGIILRTGGVVLRPNGF